jgi:hypothetical protein
MLGLNGWRLNAEIKYCTITLSETMKRATARESQLDKHIPNNVFKC